ncbi:MAG: hypothetical protein JETT_3407 [Candidatus Jettenia ecosi]|uniref:Uncharacterized protein n=1 Tax=Candidatus Jettenia ecosi TaxID=2494326 RepID=A0A533Q6V2_9BACT|nr:MAG: hypothetical protein JETT_3407 [Candidatus Jettenia ecosi]
MASNRSNRSNHEVEEAKDKAGNAISRVVDDGADALRGVAQGINNAVYR